jgi:hypothetical protein
MTERLKRLLYPVVFWYRWFRVGRCRCCGWWSTYILKSEGVHELCWLEEK